MSKHLTHAQRNHKRQQRIDARIEAGTYQPPRRELDAQAQAEQAKRRRLADLLSEGGVVGIGNPALVKAYKGGWMVNGGAGGRGKTIARTASRTLDDALYLAAVVSDAGYHITNPELLTA